MLTLKPSIFQHAHKSEVNFDPGQKKVNFGPRTKTMSSYIAQTKLVNFDPSTEVKSIMIPTVKTSQFRMPPDTSTKLISIQTLNQVIFDPHTKASQFWSLH